MPICSLNGDIRDTLQTWTLPGSIISPWNCGYQIKRGRERGKRGEKGKREKEEERNKREVVRQERERERDERGWRRERLRYRNRKEESAHQLALCLSTEEQLASADKPKLEAEAIQSIQRALNIP